MPFALSGKNSRSGSIIMWCSRVLASGGRDLLDPETPMRHFFQSFQPNPLSLLDTYARAACGNACNPINRNRVEDFWYCDLLTDPRATLKDECGLPAEGEWWIISVMDLSRDRATNVFRVRSKDIGRGRCCYEENRILRASFLVKKEDFVETPGWAWRGFFFLFFFLLT